MEWSRRPVIWATARQAGAHGMSHLRHHTLLDRGDRALNWSVFLEERNLLLLERVLYGRQRGLKVIQTSPESFDGAPHWPPQLLAEGRGLKSTGKYIDDAWGLKCA